MLPMLDGLQMNVPPAMNKRWQGMITIGICELGGEGTGGVSRDSGIMLGKTNGEHHHFPFTEPQLIVLPCLNVADVETMRGCAPWSPPLIMPLDHSSSTQLQQTIFL